MNYRELAALPAEAYLNPENFRSPFDREDSGRAQFQKGLDTGKEFDRITIAVNSVWSARREGCSCTSYEGIGYHANTAELLRGFLESGAPVYVCRTIGERVCCYRLDTTNKVAILEQTK